MAMLRFVPPDHRQPATASPPPEPAARPDSAALLQRLAQGDAQALSQLYRLEAGAVYRYALGLCGNAGWAADATQDAFVALATRPTACDVRRGSPGAWLAGVARHVLLALWQRTRHETPWLELAGDDGDTLPSADVAAAQSPETLMVRARDVGRGAAAPAAPTLPAAPSAPPAAPVAPTPPAGALLSPAAVAPVVISRTETRSEDGRHQDVEVQVLCLPREMSAAAAPMPGMSHLFNALPPPAVGLHAGRLAPRGPGVVSPLPARDIEGVRAHGERTTWTIEAGKLGNEKPIVITREVWTSPELMLTVLSRDSDPRSGEVIYRLQNLRRGEPDAALMKVPGDYEQSPSRAPKAPPAAPRG